jgi:MSHA biogenesis protein MshN
MASVASAAPHHAPEAAAADARTPAATGDVIVAGAAPAARGASEGKGPERHTAPARVTPAGAHSATRAGTHASVPSSGMTAAGAAPTDPAPGGSATPAAPTADNLYRRATAALAEGRAHEAIVALEQALRTDPRHEPSRQMLIGLLVEAGQKDAATRELQTALTLDARQPALAMLLARLQIESGGDGLETLRRSLPFAAGDGAYHAFYAGALQRAQHNRAAIEQYQVALKGAPRNGVWWMGLGISLQAEQRVPEAAQAYRNALAGDPLAPEVRAFVEQKLAQLTR